MNYMPVQPSQALYAYAHKVHKNKIQSEVFSLLKNENGCNKVVIELRRVQFWSEIILFVSSVKTEAN